MALKAVPKKSLVDQTIDQMMEAVTSAKWAIGTKIPTEPEICDSLNISRGTVREAIKALAHRGILEVRQGSGTYVATDNELLNPIEKASEKHPFEEVLYLRTGLEVAAVLGAVKNATPEQITIMEKTLENREEYRVSKDFARWVDAELEFHQQVVDSSANELLISMYKGLRPVLQENLKRQISEVSFEIPTSLQGHENLIKAIKSRDSKKALAETLGNLEEVEKYFGK